MIPSEGSESRGRYSPGFPSISLGINESRPLRHSVSLRQSGAMQSEKVRVERRK